jgi:hypothetical protein
VLVNLSIERCVGAADESRAAFEGDARHGPVLLLNLGSIA